MTDRATTHDMTFRQYEALAALAKYGNLYQLRVIDYPAKTEETHERWRPVDPDDPKGYHKQVHDDVVRWLLERGYAEATGDFDAMFSRGKVLPTDAGRARLENHGLTRDSKGVGTHLSHCCLTRHGCKYGDEFCPVVTGMFKPDSDTCGACYEDDSMDEESVGFMPDYILINELQSRGYVVTGDPEENDAEG